MGVELRYDGKAGGFGASIEVSGEPCELLLLDLGEGQAEEARTLAARVQEWAAAGVEAAKAYAAAELLTLKNDAWLGEGEASIDAATFVGSLTLAGVNAFPDGTFEVYFDDGDLFWGHSVQVDVDAGDSFARAEMVG